MKIAPGETRGKPSPHVPRRPVGPGRLSPKDTADRRSFRPSEADSSCWAAFPGLRPPRRTSSWAILAAPRREAWAPQASRLESGNAVYSYCKCGNFIFLPEPSAAEQPQVEDSGGARGQPHEKEAERTRPSGPGLCPLSSNTSGRQACIVQSALDSSDK
jgi:hypothetical protein